MLQGLLGGLQIGIDRQLHVQVHDGDERLDGRHPRQRSVLIVRQDFGEENPCEGAEGAQIPLRGDAHARVCAPNGEPAGDVRHIEVARRETQERVGLRRLDMRQPLRVSQQPAGLFKPQQMGIKLLDDLMDMGLHPRAQGLQSPGGGHIQSDKGFAGPQLSRVSAVEGHLLHRHASPCSSPSCAYPQSWMVRRIRRTTGGLVQYRLSMPMCWYQGCVAPQP